MLHPVAIFDKDLYNYWNVSIFFLKQFFSNFSERTRRIASRADTEMPSIAGINVYLVNFTKQCLANTDSDSLGLIGGTFRLKVSA